MISYKVKYHKKAYKFIKENKLIGLRFVKAFCDISNDIKNVTKYDIKKLHNPIYNDIFRLRIGKYRAVFRIINKEIIIFVFDIDSRGQIYKTIK